MMGLKTLCQLAYGGPLAIWKPAHMKQQLVLQVGYAMAVCCRFAEPQEAPQLIAEIGKRLEILFAQRGQGHCDPFLRWHLYHVVIYINHVRLYRGVFGTPVQEPETYHGRSAH
jgi:hypothetical protein